MNLNRELFYSLLLMSNALFLKRAYGKHIDLGEMPCYISLQVVIGVYRTEVCIHHFSYNYLAKMVVEWKWG